MPDDIADLGLGEIAGDGEIETGGNTDIEDALDDNVEVSKPTISINDISADEDAETATFTVTLSKPYYESVTVDYVAPDGSNGTLTFNPGETSKTFTSTWTDDNVEEANEIVNATLSNASNATISDATGQLTIINDDVSVTITGTSNDDQYSTSQDVETFNTGDGDDTITVNLADNSIAEDTFNMGDGYDTLILKGNDAVLHTIIVDLADLTGTNIDQIHLADGTAEKIIINPADLAGFVSNNSENEYNESYSLRLVGQEEDSVEISEDFIFQEYRLIGGQIYQIYEHSDYDVTPTIYNILTVSMKIGTITGG